MKLKTFTVCYYYFANHIFLFYFEIEISSTISKLLPNYCYSEL